MDVENNDSELLLIDLSSLAHPLFHMSTDPSTMHVALVDRVRALASQHPHCGVFCDSGKSFRADIDPTYKANRPESDAVLHHEIALAVDTLKGDGFPVVSVKGYEADDLIASATVRALEIPETTVLIVSADKDLLALVNGRVRAKSLRDGSILDAAAVAEKMGVDPEQIADYLALVGDKSDNIVGAKGIGAVTAAKLLKTFGTLTDLYAAIDRSEALLLPAVMKSLVEFRERWPTVRQLIALKTDVPVPFAEIAAERVPKNQEPEMGQLTDAAQRYDDAATLNAMTDQVNTGTRRIEEAIGSAADHPRLIQPRTATEITPDVLAPAPVEFERQLEPRSIPEAQQLAKWMYEARLFSGYGSPQAVLSTILAGRELGFQAIASLRAFHLIENKHSLAADAMRAKVLRSGLAKYFRIVERTDEKATWETWRVGDPSPVPFTYTIQEGRQAFQGSDQAWDKSNWARRPKNMLTKTASAELCRLVYADILFGLYAPEELER